MLYIVQLFEPKLHSYQITHKPTPQDSQIPLRQRMGEKQEVFEVEAILDYRVHDGREEFKVKWKGFSMKECTWEPTINLEGCIDMVKDFKIKHGLWFKREPYKEPTKSDNDRNEESSGDQGEEKSIAQSATNNFEPDEENLLDKYKAQADQEVTPLVLPEKTEAGCQPERVDKCMNIDDKTSQPITLLRMLKNRNNEIFFRVESAGQIKVLSRSQIYKLNVNLLLKFYEQHLEIGRGS